MAYVQAIGASAGPSADCADAADRPLKATDFRDPAIRLSGAIDFMMYQNFRDQLARAPQQGLVVIELYTLGGDPDVARMMGEDVRFQSEMAPERRFAFLGKAAVYSAGATFMSFFARVNRYLTRGARLMVHERRLTRTLQIDGPLTACVADVRALSNEIASSIAIQNEGFANLIFGSNVTLDEIITKAAGNWYIEAQDAKTMGLIEGVL